MAADIIVSYDGTPNDDDALALGRALAAGGATLALAYVRHARETDPRGEELAEHDARRRLEAGLQGLGDQSVATHVVHSAGTDLGLEQLAAELGARLIVFGSDYRTTPGRAEPGNTAQRMLEGAPVAVAVARAGLRAEADASVLTVAVAPPDGPGPAHRAASRLADSLGARMVENGTRADLILVASALEGRPGRLSLSGSARAALDSARGSVAVLPAGAASLF
ncbi:MAG TPA: universal stress protein [Solirubrobacteraceae bacterium]|jgi:nucleotide-binding universal stress UspA family protein|nr:universal stress protein [Solirubrobacteraceae bacterium]